MTYQPYLIAAYATGLDKEVEPWLLPDDAQEDLFDGFVYRGVWQKREGYNYFATGNREGVPYCESRIVKGESAVLPAAGVINGINKTFTFTFTGPIMRGSIVIIGDNPVQNIGDDGVGGFTGDFDPLGPNSIDYTTGIVIVTFAVAPILGSNVSAAYNWYPGNPVMMIASFYTDQNARIMIVADTQYVNRYNTVTNRLDYIPSTTTPYTGTNKDFFSWVNYPTAADVPRLLFTNNVNVVQSYDGSTVTDYTYDPASPFSSLTALQIFNFKDRLVLIRTTEDNVVFPRRIRISGTGQSCDDFSLNATGAGFIDIPDNTWIMGAAYNRDDLIIFTASTIWSLKYTGNDTTPFILYKIEESRGSGAAFSAITYLNRTTAVSPLGFVITDGYRVERMDDTIPQYSFNEIDQENFDLCFAGSVDQDRDHYLIHPSSGKLESDRILVTNYEEDNFAIYRIGLSCMGNYIDSFSVTWNDLLIYDNWDAFATQYNTWGNFGYTKGTPIAIGGGHHGEIWRLNLVEGEDNPVKIRNIVTPDPSQPNILEITTDFNNYQASFAATGQQADYIFFENLPSIPVLNDKQFPIETIITDHYTFQIDTESVIPVVYSGGGDAARVIPFESTTKNFNPFANMDKKVRCGWLYMYVSVSDTFLTDVDGNPEPAIITIEVYTNDCSQPTQILNFNVSPYQGDSSNLPFEIGTKKWTKLWINQTARFIQFKVKNTQAGSKIKIHAMMPGFAPVGRLIA